MNECQSAIDAALRDRIVGALAAFVIFLGIAGAAEVWGRIHRRKY
jgi:hypothetical protein